MENNYVNKSKIIVSPIEISAAHFIHTTEPESKCQRMHGHNYIVDVVLRGNIAKNNMVVDANDVKAIVDQLDHKTLVAKDTIDQYDDEYIDFINPVGTKRYSMPIDDCFIMDIDSLSAESMARWLTIQFLDKFPNVNTATVSVSETSKLTAVEETSRYRTSMGRGFVQKDDDLTVKE